MVPLTKSSPTITQAQFNNLTALGHFIGKLDDKYFDMQSWRAYKDEKRVRETRFFSLNECGTVGCALGWLPQALEIPEEELKEFFDFDILFSKSALSFSSLSAHYLGISVHSTIGDYLFSSDYAKGPNFYKSAENSDRVPSKEQKRLFLERLEKTLHKYVELGLVEGEL